MKRLFLPILIVLITFVAKAEDGYRLWLRYDLIQNSQVAKQYRSQITGIHFPSLTPTLQAAHKELFTGLSGLLGQHFSAANTVTNGSLVIGTPKSNPIIASLHVTDLTKVGNEGFVITSTTTGGKKITVIAANTDKGVLYGTFHFLRLLQTGQNISALSITSKPDIDLRILNHWDNLDRTVERGYAGFSIWDWHKLPGYIDKRYIDYARANASIGINGTVLTNVNANALVLTPTYLEKVAALADAFRPYGIKVYLTARFSAPIEIGGLKTADPLNKDVQQWWNEKTAEIYKYVPDFGGFLVKANSEGQPGPQNYNRTHADGANMLAQAVAPFGGIVMWRAFVYSNETPDDRFKQAYNEFKPLDGQFRKNVLVQVKNGPIDFQPREPFHPLFGAMPKTPLMMEFQITQEYLGQATNLVYLSPMFKEVLDADTYAQGKGSTVAKVLDGSLYNHELSGMAGVSNIGNDRNWTGHPFAQSNWYAMGRLAWNMNLSSGNIADEWIKQTFSQESKVVDTLQKMMLASHGIMVNYMNPLGLHHIMGNSHHYGPAPWSNNSPRADWDPVYYHRADAQGLGFDRTASGSNALAQYAPEVREKYSNMQTCPEEFLLWFHHVPWTFKMNSGRNLWEELVHRYYSGVEGVRWMQTAWNGLQGQIDEERFEQVKQLLAVQEKEAVWWRNAVLLYFQTFSKMPIPAQYEQPDHTLEYYQALKFPFAPGI